MKHPLTISFATLIFAYLACTHPAPATAGITTGTLSCPQGKATKVYVKSTNMEEWGCSQSLGVHVPRHGGGSNPDDWGMCGVLSIAGTFGPPTVAEIVVNTSGEYTAQVAGYMPSVVPTLQWTCVLFTDFHGVPPPSDVTASGPTPDGYSFNGGSGEGGLGLYPLRETIPGSAGSACIWAGLLGNLETINDNGTGGGTDGGFGTAAAQYLAPTSSFASLNVKTFAFCNGYSAPTWRGWHYLLHGTVFVTAPAAGMSIGQNKSRSWCYMQGIEAGLLYPTYEVGPLSASLGISPSGDYSIATTASPSGSPSGAVGISINCLPLEQ